MCFPSTVTVIVETFETSPVAMGWAKAVCKAPEMPCYPSVPPPEPAACGVCVEDNPDQRTIADLPAATLELIFHQLSPQDLARCGTCCRAWRSHTATCALIWSEHCRTRWSRWSEGLWHPVKEAVTWSEVWQIRYEVRQPNLFGHMQGQLSGKNRANPV